MALSLEQIVKQLEDSGIVASETLKDFIPPKADPKTPEELVSELVKSENLTTFQGQQVKAGRVKSLILGAYTILDKIGAGGMGQVFKARHRKMERLVAIKMLPPAMTKDAVALARFQREVVAAARLRHPNIVAADDAAEANGVHFLVMEYVDGKDLSALVKKNGPLPVNKAVNYILQAARGLEFAHSEGVVHRDIKPANLLLDKKEVVKILDMGLARLDIAGAAGPQDELTGTGTIMGTVDYMAPEQAVNTKHADQRADIYSLGISLYYLVAGRAPYTGDTVMEKFLAHREQPIPSLQDAQTTVSKQLDAVFKRMVAKRIEERYQTMSEVVEALEGLGYGGSSTGRKGDVASTLDLSSADRKKLLSQAKKKPLGSITEVVASEKSKNLLLKIVGGSFGTIVAPILVFYLIRHLDKQEQPAAPPAANAPAATVQPVEVATNAATQAPRIEDDGSPKPMKAPFDAAAAKAGQAAWAKHMGTQVETTNSIGMRMTLIPPGEFMMGSTPEQVAAAKKMGLDDKMPPTDQYFQRLPEEMPQHMVTISQPFLMGSTEVTVAQFRKFVEASKYSTEAEKYGFGDSFNVNQKEIEKAKPDQKGKDWKNPGNSITDDTAVTQVTWNDACAYCAWLSEQEQRQPWYRPGGDGGFFVVTHANGYRLPTEAEWEYACRAGTTTQYSFGDDKTQLERYGSFKKYGDRRAPPVALKLPNSFGLFDMHGHPHEWCQDWYDGKWYETSSPTDPTGPSFGSSRLVRGGFWGSGVSFCRSASRNGQWPSSRCHNFGFRIVRPLDASQPETAVATTAKPSASPTQPTQPWNTPAFQQWVADTQKLPPGKQIEAVSKKLMELNPGFDGKVRGYDVYGTPKIENGEVTGCGFDTENVTDISPVRALPGLKALDCSGTKNNKGWTLSDLSPLKEMALTMLNCSESKISDLSPLKEMALTMLNCSDSKISDLSPLEGMPLTSLVCFHTRVWDLSPLHGMPLTFLSFHGTPVSDLSPLTGMPLTSLICADTKVSDLSPLAGASLIQLSFTPMNITKGIEVVRQMRSLRTIGWRGELSPAEFWKKFDAGEFDKAAAPAKLAYLDPAFQTWVKATQALPADRQIEAVSKKLMELNPGFDGVLAGFDARGKPHAKPKVEGNHVTEIGFFNDHVSDLSPVRAFPKLQQLACYGSVASKRGMLSDLSPLSGMSLTKLTCSDSKVADLSPLQGMPLTWFACGATDVSDLSPLKGMELTTLQCSVTAVRDLSPLQGLPINDLGIHDTPVSDLSPLTTVPKLEKVNVRGTKVTAAQVAALQKALPNCKIDWDGAAKPKTPEPAAAGSK